MPVYRIAPSILSADFARLGEEVRAVASAGADLIHFDVMDNHYVPNLTVGPLVCAALRPHVKLPLDVHLMIEQPERYVDDFVNAGASMLSVHVEAARHLHRTIALIKSRGIRAGAEFGATTIPRFYALHMLVIPGLIAALIGAHLYLVVKLGTTAPPWLRANAKPKALRKEEVG